ncbi:alpha/beta fold hydrolase [Sphingomonas sp. SRS2]|uniref:alpha/beta fold hydrolase n=1 Tax=Sphingomonas sp. SRS2 TaxID=133190 RepID=UPI000AAADB86|nr:alpha/beta hydrolase [Sphingomonas sp. SRS2]
MIDGLDTGYYEAGSGPTVVLLHGGEHGSSAELTWEFNFHALAGGFHVIAPDWLGFGTTAKVHDFELGAQRRLAHMQRFLAYKEIDKADLIGCSMGGALAVRALSADSRSLPARSLVLIGSGGNAPDNIFRRALLDYDCTISGMRKIVEALIHDPSWSRNDAYVERRFRSSIEPGAWECSAAARFKNPLVSVRSEFGQVDTTRYENIDIPVLVIGGEFDVLKEPGYAPHLARRFPRGEAYTVPNAGHLSNIEQADEVNGNIIAFLRRVNGNS